MVATDTLVGTRVWENWWGGWFYGVVVCPGMRKLVTLGLRVSGLPGQGDHAQVAGFPNLRLSHSLMRKVNEQQDTLTRNEKHMVSLIFGILKKNPDTNEVVYKIETGPQS